MAARFGYPPSEDSTDDTLGENQEEREQYLTKDGNGYLALESFILFGDLTFDLITYT